MINPQSKRDYMDLTWHDMTEKFDSVVKLKESLMESFPEYVPSTLDYQVGYLEGRNSQKRWIVRFADLEKMYKAYEEGEEIKLWCEGKVKECAQGKNRKSIEQPDNVQPPSKRDCQAEEEQEIHVHIRLEKKHCDKYTGPQYSLWAKFIRMGRHDDYKQPPAFPLTTGEQKSQPKTSVSDAVAGAAAAITNALTSQSKCSSPLTSKKSGNALSPNNQANLRRKHLEDLRMLSNSRDDGVLTEEEFHEQKLCIMSGLKKLTHHTE